MISQPTRPHNLWLMQNQMRLSKMYENMPQLGRITADIQNKKTCQCDWICELKPVSVSGVKDETTTTWSSRSQNEFHWTETAQH